MTDKVEWPDLVCFAPDSIQIEPDFVSKITKSGHPRPKYPAVLLRAVKPHPQSPLPKIPPVSNTLPIGKGNPRHRPKKINLKTCKCMIKMRILNPPFFSVMWTKRKYIKYSFRIHSLYKRFLLKRILSYNLLIIYAMRALHFWPMITNPRN